MVSSLSHDSQFSLNNNDLESLPLLYVLDLLAGGNFEERWTIAKVLVKYGDEVIAPLKSVVLDEDAEGEYRWYALKILSQLKNPQIILIISELLANTVDEDLIALATQTLSSQGEEAIATLTPLLSIPEYRLSVTKALAQIPHSKVIQPLLSVVNDDDVAVRVSAIASLNNFDTPEIVSTLTKALEDYSAIVRKEAITGLALKTKSSTPENLAEQIIPFLHDIDLKVCQQTAISLSRLKTNNATSALYNTLISPHTPVLLQKTIIKALAWQETTLSIECLGKALYLVPESIIIEIIGLFSRIRNHKKFPQIIQLTLDFYQLNSLPKTSPQIIKNLCYTWEKLNAQPALKYLAEIAHQGDENIEIYAQSALQRINQ